MSSIGQSFGQAMVGNSGLSSLYVSRSDHIKFWRNALSRQLKTAISFIAIDEVHLIEEWGLHLDLLKKELSFIRSCLPTVPIMALSATAPLFLITSVTQHLNMPMF